MRFRARRVGRDTYYVSQGSPGAFLLALFILLVLIVMAVKWAVGIARAYPAIPVLLGVAVAAAVFFAVKERRLAKAAEAVRRLHAEVLARGAAVAALLAEAEKGRFIEKPDLERECLLRALYEIRERGLTDADLTTLAASGAKQYPTVAEIERRARELGWNGESIRKHAAEPAKPEGA